MKFFDAPGVKDQLFPFTLTRSVEEMRIGIITLAEKWRMIAGEHYPHPIPSHLIPSEKHRLQVLSGAPVTVEASDLVLERPWHIFQHNAAAIRVDFDLITAGRISAPLSPTNKVIGSGGIFLEEGATVEYSIFNTSTGPVYIGKNAEVMEGCLVRGPLALCEGAVLKMGTKVYGATTLGPFCTGGGEIKNSVLFGYSNKGHDGYLGDSVIGEWCNLGAGVSNSNLKNNAGAVGVFDPLSGTFADAGTKCGLLMGDYSRAAINTSFNTGTITGISCNIFGAGLAPKYIPSFAWGSEGGKRYEFDKAISDILNWKKLKKHNLSPEEVKLLRSIFDNL